MSSFKQMTEKLIGNSYHIMKWNPLMDLMVVASKSSDEISLHRLIEWQKVWSLNLGQNRAPKPLSKISGIKSSITDVVWRPDGKVIAASLSRNIAAEHDNSEGDSCICLIEIEHASLVHVIQVESSVISNLCWTPKVSLSQNENDMKYQDYLLSDPNDFLEPIKPSLKYKQIGSLPMRKLSEENIKDFMKVDGINNLMLLAAGTCDGQVLLYALGLMKIATLKVDETSQVLSIDIIDDYSNVIIHHSSNDSVDIHVETFSLSDISQNCLQYLTVAQVYANVLTYQKYLNDTICLLLESWDDILSEIDSKMSSYFKSPKMNKSLDKMKEDGDDVSHDTKRKLSSDEFMELLMFGTSSDLLSKFLHDVGEKGLRKLGQSIETTYSNVQRLVVLSLERVCYHLMTSFVTLKGMAVWKAEFEAVQLDIDLILATINSIGSFLLKTSEFQQVVDKSIRNVKSFFRWLMSVMIRMFSDHGLNNSVSNDSSKISQQDLQFVAQFIDDNFERFDDGDSTKDSNNSTKKSSMFTLEPVGQYLADCDLVYTGCPINNLSLNPWIKFMESNPTLFEQFQSHQCLNMGVPFYKHNFERSLFQEFKVVDSSINRCFESVIGTNNQAVSGFQIDGNKPNLLFGGGRKFIFSHITSLEDEFNYSTFSNSAQHVFVIKTCFEDLSKIQVNCLKFISQNQEELKIVDFSSFSSEFIFFLLSNSHDSTYLVKIPFTELLEGAAMVQTPETSVSLDIKSKSGHTTISLANNGSMAFQKLPGNSWTYLSVSGSRKVVCVASSRRVKVFESEIDDDEGGATPETSAMEVQI